MLAHGELAADQQLQSFSNEQLLQACSTTWGCCDTSAGQGIPLVEPHTAALSPWIQPVQIPL